MSLVNVGTTWLRHTIAWSNSWSSWQERCVMLAFLLGAALAGWLSTLLTFWQSLALWTGYFAALTIATRQGWLKLFGPVLFYDMITTARRSRYVVMRLLYASVLLGILCFMYLVAAERGGRRNESTLVMFLMAFFVLMIAFAAEIILLIYVESPWMRWSLLAMLFMTVSIFVCGAFMFNIDDQQNNPRDMQNQAATMSQNFFSMFMMVQLALVVLLTPAYVAGAISEEKDRKTMEFMLATDLQNREIVLSKLLSRLSNMTLFLLTGLPILSVLQFLGGVDTQLMFLGFLATGLTMLGIGSVSILFSTLFQKPRDSIGVTYLVIITYIALGTTFFGTTAGGSWLGREKLWDGDLSPTYGDVSDVFNAGNPLTGVIEIGNAISGGPRIRGGPAAGPATLATALPGLIERYAWFHVPLSIFCIAVSIARLRAVALKHGEGQSQTLGTLIARLRGVKPVEGDKPSAPKVSWWDRFREPVGEAPMLWKELHIEGRSGSSWITLIAGGLLVMLTVGSGLIVVGVFLWDMLLGGGAQFHDLPQSMNIWFRIAGSCVGSLMLLMVAVRGSTSITTERERDTFDALVATPLTAETILLSKLLGSMVSLRTGWLWFGSMLAIGVLTGGVHLLAVPIVVTAWFIYALLFSMVGLWFSMACTSSMRATVYTVMSSLFLGGGHWLLTGMCCFIPLALMRIDRPGDFAEYLMKFELGLTVPWVLGFSSYSWQDLQRNFNHRDFGEFFIFNLIGLFLCAMACPVLWYGVLLPKFKEIMRREELIYK